MATIQRVTPFGFVNEALVIERVAPAGFINQKGVATGGPQTWPVSRVELIDFVGNPGGQVLTETPLDVIDELIVSEADVETVTSGALDRAESVAFGDYSDYRIGSMFEVDIAEQLSFDERALTMVELAVVADVDDASWTSSLGDSDLTAVLDPDDADYIQSPNNPSGETSIVQLAPGVFPLIHDVLPVAYRIGQTGVGNCTVTVSLYCGTTFIASWTHATTDTLTTYTQWLTEEQIATIADPGNLRLEFEADTV